MNRIAILCVLLGCGARTDLPVDDEPGASVELCNFEDDDGDGLIDEGEQECGLGPCRKIVGMCDECTPFDGEPEVCDGIDNDCDGAVDNNLDPTLIGGPVTIFAGPFSNAMELVPTPEGLLAVIAAKSIGGTPNNVVVTRRLGLDGNPIAEPVVFDDLHPSQGPTLSESADGLFHMTICTPQGSENRLSSQLVDPFGERVGPLVRREPTRSCGAGESHSLWTGFVHISAWVENSSAPTFETEILLDVSNRELRSRDSQILLDDSGDLVSQPYFVRVGDRVLMIAGRIDPPDFRQQLQSWVFDLEGRIVAGPNVIDTPEMFRSRGPRLAALRASALLVVANRSGPGVLVGELGLDGAVVGSLRWMDDTTGRYDFPAIAGRGNEVVYAATVSSPGVAEKGEVLGLDARGEIRWRYQHRLPEEPGYFAWPAVVQIRGRTYVLYSTPLSEEFFEERLIVLGCDPRLGG